MMSADPYMLMGKGVGSSSEGETVIVAHDGGHPGNLHHFYARLAEWLSTVLTSRRGWFDPNTGYQI
jgi:hypothetical protein